MKKLMLLLLTVVLSLSLTAPACASCISNPEMQASTTPAQNASRFSLETSSAGEQYLLNETTGEKTIAAYAYNEDGELVKISLSDCKRIKESSPALPSDNVPTSQAKAADLILPNAITYRYVEKSSYVESGTPIKVSADMRGPGKITTIQATTVSCSFGGDISLTGTIKKKIELGASFAWNASLSTEASNSYEFDPIPAGEIGYVQFIPYYNVSIGDLYQGNSESSLPDTYKGEVWGQSPKKLASGLADGLYELVIK